NRAAGLRGVRHGPSLLGGLLVCARCGRHLLVSYTNAGRGLRYSCLRGRSDYGEPPCQSLSGRRLDALVSTQVLEALQPAALELHLATAAERRGLVRFVIERVEGGVEGATDRVEVAIHWAGGVVSRHTLARAVQRYEQLADYPRLRARVAELRAAGKSMAAVAGCLNRE